MRVPEVIPNAGIFKLRCHCEEQSDVAIRILLQGPSTPSSVTFGDSFSQREKPLAGRAKQKAVTESSVTAELFKNVKENDLTKQGECGKIVV
jgi:hypothetical protein